MTDDSGSLSLSPPGRPAGRGSPSASRAPEALLRSASLAAPAVARGGPAGTRVDTRVDRGDWPGVASRLEETSSVRIELGPSLTVQDSAVARCHRRSCDEPPLSDVLLHHRVPRGVLWTPAVGLMATFYW